MKLLPYCSNEESDGRAVDFVQIANMAQVLYLRKKNYQKPPRLFLFAGEDVVHESLADASVFKACHFSYFFFSFFGVFFFSASAVQASS